MNASDKTEIVLYVLMLVALVIVSLAIVFQAQIAIHNLQVPDKSGKELAPKSEVLEASPDPALGSSGGRNRGEGGSSGGRSTLDTPKDGKHLSPDGPMEPIRGTPGRVNA